MSRSRKKHGWLKYGSMYSGRRYNKKFRVRNKHRIRMGKDPYLMNELVNPWDVHDVRQYWEWDWRISRQKHPLKWWQSPRDVDEAQIKREYFRK